MGVGERDELPTCDGRMRCGVMTLGAGRHVGCARRIWGVVDLADTGGGGSWPQGLLSGARTEAAPRRLLCSFNRQAVARSNLHEL